MPVTSATAIPVSATVPVPVTSARTISVTATAPVTSAMAIAVTGTVTVAMSVAATGAATGTVAGALTAGGSTVTTGRTGTLAATETRSVLTAARGAESPVTPVSGSGALRPGLPLPASGGEIMAVALAVAVSGAGSAGRLGRWVGGTLRRGHRPIIARTRGALCSPRQNCR
jgi:hypothetical protein